MNISSVNSPFRRSDYTHVAGRLLHKLVSADHPL